MSGKYGEPFGLNPSNGPLNPGRILTYSRPERLTGEEISKRLVECANAMEGLDPSIARGVLDWVMSVPWGGAFAIADEPRAFCSTVSVPFRNEELQRLRFLLKRIEEKP